MRLLLIFFILLFGLHASDSNTTEHNNSKKPKKKAESSVEFEVELDAYYSNISWTFPLTNKPIPNAKDKTELGMYYDLLKDSFPPRFIILELSANPLPLLGTYLKEQEPTFYNESTIGNVNLVNSITAGFEVPYALSIFVGNTVKFTEPGAKKAGSNRAYSGVLFSFSDQHIKDNVLIEDNSLELELKILGSRALADY